MFMNEKEFFKLAKELVEDYADECCIDSEKAKRYLLNGFILGWKTHDKYKKKQAAVCQTN